MSNDKIPVVPILFLIVGISAGAGHLVGVNRTEKKYDDVDNLRKKIEKVATAEIDAAQKLEKKRWALEREKFSLEQRIARQRGVLKKVGMLSTNETFQAHTR